MKKLFINIIYFVFFIYAFFIIYTNSTNIFNAIDYLKTCQTIYPKDRVILMTMNDLNINNNEFNERVKEIIEGRGYIINLNTLSIDFLEDNSYEKDVLRIMEEESKKYKGNYESNISGFGTFIVFGEVDPDFYSLYDIDIYEGRKFTQKELEGDYGDYIPIIVGYNLKDYYKVGDVLTQNYPLEYYDIKDGEATFIINEEGDYQGYEIEKYKVIGIAEKDNLFIYENPLRADVDYSDSIMYKPKLTYQRYSFYDKDNNLLEKGEGIPVIPFEKIIINEGENREEVIQELEGKIPGVTFTEYEVINSAVIETNRILKEEVPFIGIITLIIIITLIVINAYLIEKNYIKYGIYLSLGKSISEIVNDLFIINFLKVFLSMIISIILGTFYMDNVKSNYYNFITINNFNIKALILLIILAIIFSIITPLKAIKELNKKTVVELIRGL